MNILTEMLITLTEMEFDRKAQLELSVSGILRNYKFLMKGYTWHINWKPNWCLLLKWVKSVKEKILLNPQLLFAPCLNPELHLTLYKKWNFTLRISSVTVTKSEFPADLATFTEEIPHETLRFLNLLRKPKTIMTMWSTLILKLFSPVMSSGQIWISLKKREA